MKNRKFKYLSLEKKQEILKYVLREKTNSGLTAEEESRLLSKLSCKDQFRIRVFSDANAYRKAMCFVSDKDNIVFGADEFRQLKEAGKHPLKTIAVITEASENPERRNQAYIFIPPWLNCGRECVGEKIIYAGGLS